MQCKLKTVNPVLKIFVTLTLLNFGTIDFYLAVTESNSSYEDIVLDFASNKQI